MSSMQHRLVEDGEVIAVFNGISTRKPETGDYYLVIVDFEGERDTWYVSAEYRKNLAYYQSLYAFYFDVYGHRLPPNHITTYKLVSTDTRNIA